MSPFTQSDWLNDGVGVVVESLSFTVCCSISHIIKIVAKNWRDPTWHVFHLAVMALAAASPVWGEGRTPPKKQKGVRLPDTKARLHQGMWHFRRVVQSMTSILVPHPPPQGKIRSNYLYLLTPPPTPIESRCNRHKHKEINDTGCITKVMNALVHTQSCWGNRFSECVCVCVCPIGGIVLLIACRSQPALLTNTTHWRPFWSHLGCFCTHIALTPFIAS